MGIVHSKFDDLSQGFSRSDLMGEQLPPIHPADPGKVITDDEYT